MSNPDWIWSYWGELEEETRNLGKRLEWRERDDTWWDE